MMYLLDLDAELESALRLHLKKADGVTPSNLEESIHYSLLGPGKRIRPRLLLATAEMLGLSSETALPAALALEMIHCFTLIHDDLPCMDNDDFRRGRPSNHKKFGESVALLAGDALMALAMDVFLDTPIDTATETSGGVNSSIRPAFLTAGLKHLVWAMGPRGVIGGQAAESLLGRNSTLDQLKSMHAQKTGALFAASLLIPKEFSGISDDSPSGKALIHFAQILGLAFQAADDLEDSQTAQGALLGEENTDPKSILFYLSAQEVRDSIIPELTSATAEITALWGDRAKNLQSISNEVIQKIRNSQNEKIVSMGH